MERGISKAGENEYLIMQARNQLETHFQQQQSVVSSSSNGSSSSPDEDPPPDAMMPRVSPNPAGSSLVSSSDGVGLATTPRPQVAAQVGVGGGGFIDTPIYTFTLPDLTVYPGNFFNRNIFISKFWWRG